MGYTEPKENGYCVLAGYSDHQARKHEHCQCRDVKMISKCQEMCHNDDMCNGYSFATVSNKCYLYTTSPCDSNCYKKKSGSIGDIVQKSQKNSQESGCYIKERGNL